MYEFILHCCDGMKHNIVGVPDQSYLRIAIDIDRDYEYGTSLGIIYENENIIRHMDNPIKNIIEYVRTRENIDINELKKIISENILNLSVAGVNYVAHNIINKYSF